MKKLTKMMPHCLAPDISVAGHAKAPPGLAASIHVGLIRILLSKTTKTGDLSFHLISFFISFHLISFHFIAFCSFIHSFIHSSIHSFLPSFIHSFIHSFLHSFIHSFLHSFIPSFLHSFIPSFLHSFIHSFIHPSIVRSFVRSFLHSFIHSFIQSYISWVCLPGFSERWAAEFRQGFPATALWPARCLHVLLKGWIPTPAGRALPARSWYNCLWYSSLYPHL